MCCLESWEGAPYGGGRDMGQGVRVGWGFGAACVMWWCVVAVKLGDDGGVCAGRRKRRQGGKERSQRRRCGKSKPRHPGLRLEAHCVSQVGEGELATRRRLGWAWDGRLWKVVVASCYQFEVEASPSSVSVPMLSLGKCARRRSHAEIHELVLIYNIFTQMN